MRKKERAQEGLMLSFADADMEKASDASPKRPRRSGENIAEVGAEGCARQALCNCKLLASLLARHGCWRAYQRRLDAGLRSRIQEALAREDATNPYKSYIQCS